MKKFGRSLYAKILDGKAVFARRDGSKIVPVEDLDFTKEVNGSYVFIREAVSTATLQAMKAYFKQDVKVTVRKRISNKHLYLIVIGGKIHPRDFASESMMLEKKLGVQSGNITTSVDLVSIGIDHPLVNLKKIGKPKKISEKTFEAFKKQKAYLGLFKNENLVYESA